MQGTEFPTLAHPRMQVQVRNLRAEGPALSARLVLPGGIVIEVSQDRGGRLTDRLAQVRAAIEALLDGGAVLGREEVLEVGRTLTSVRVVASLSHDGLTAGALERIGRLVAEGMTVCPTCERHEGPDLPSAPGCKCVARRTVEVVA